MKKYQKSLVLTDIWLLHRWRNKVEIDRILRFCWQNIDRIEVGRVNDIITSDYILDAIEYGNGEIFAYASVIKEINGCEPSRYVVIEETDENFYISVHEFGLAQYDNYVEITRYYCARAANRHAGHLNRIRGKAIKHPLYVKDLTDKKDELMFISDSQEVEPVNEYFGVKEPYDSFFLKIEDGDYVEVWGMYGIIPYLNKCIYKVL